MNIKWDGSPGNYYVVSMLHLMRIKHKKPNELRGNSSSIKHVTAKSETVRYQKIEFFK